MGVTQALDRVRLVESLVKGPFTARYPGELYFGTCYCDKDSTVFYPYSLESAKAHFAAAGLEDTDGDGFLNHPADVMCGADLQVTLLHNIDYQNDKKPRRGHRRHDGRGRHPSGAQLAVGQRHGRDARFRALRLVRAAQHVGADHGGAAHDRARADRAANRLQPHGQRGGARWT